MEGSYVSIAWGDFQNRLIHRLKQYINKTDLSDITLVTKDNRKIPAHKLILSSGSTFFRGLFAEDLGHQHPLLYLPGVGTDVLEAILHFLYQGQVQIRREQVKEFLAMAEDLGVEGLNKDMDQGSNLQHETNYSLDNTSLGNVKETDEDDWFEKVNHQKDEPNSVNEKVSNGIFETNQLANTKILNTLCYICNINFINSKDLKDHKKIHKTKQKSDRPFKCNVCSFEFEQINLLKHHYNSHANISNTEKVHIPKRGPDNLFKCTVCETSINNISNYRRHYQRMHIMALQYCDKCEFTTTTGQGIKTHKLRKHCLAKKQNTLWININDTRP